MEKVIREGKVAVLISPRHGAGWYSWHTGRGNDGERLLFDPKLIELVERNRRQEITEEWILENLGIEGVYCGGSGNLEIIWVKEGTAFEINEYDGSESLTTLSDLTIVA